MPEPISPEKLEEMIHEEISELKCQPVGFREIRRAVMRKVWEVADRLEEQGYVLTHDMFKKLLREVWEEIKKLPACPIE